MNRFEDDKTAKPLVSVIIPVYGVEKLLDKCVESVVNQTYKNLEIFLVDDESPDKCPQMCDEWAKRDSRIKVLHKKNGGQGTARNLALDHVTGDYISFVDSDDYILPNMYEVMVSAAVEYGADITFCGCILDSKVKKHIVEPFDLPKTYDNRELMYAFVANTEILTVPWNKLYKSYLLKEIRFPSFRAHEDAYMLADVMAACNSAVHVGKPLYVQYIRPGSTENSAFSEKNLVMLDVASHTVDIYAKYSPENLVYAELKQLKETLYLMQKIIASFSYSKYKNVYGELLDELTVKYGEFIQKYPDMSERLGDVELSLKHNLRFRASCRVNGTKARVKALIKKVLAKIK